MDDIRPHQIWRALAQRRPRLVVEQHTGALGMGKYLLGERVLSRIACGLRAKGCALVLATTLREPVARARSLAIFQRVPHAKYVAFVRTVTDGQLRYVWDGGQAGALNESSPVLERRVRHALSHFALIGRTEALADFGAALLAVLGWRHAAHGPLSRLNTANQSAGRTYALSHAELELTRRHNEGDGRLYRSLLARGPAPPLGSSSPCPRRSVKDPCRGNSKSQGIKF